MEKMKLDEQWGDKLTIIIVIIGVIILGGLLINRNYNNTRKEAFIAGNCYVLYLYKEEAKIDSTLPDFCDIEEIKRIYIENE